MTVKRFEGWGILAWPLAFLYGIGLSVHRGLYQLGLLNRYQAPVAVISIGNIVAGGAGKTPMSVWVVLQLLKVGKKPGIVLRGYKSVDGLSDEASMLKEILPQVPVVANPNRRQAIEQMMKSYDVNVLVCDDAFQHWPLQRDLDIVLIDATQPFGNNFLLPAGMLREPVGALQRADVLVVTKSDDDKPALALIEQLHQRFPQALLVRARHQFKGVRDVFTQQPVEWVVQEKVMACCSIADPASFLRTLTVAGFVVLDSCVWPDHAPYTASMVNSIKAMAQLRNVSTVVTTHKDAVKLGQFKQALSGLKVVCVDIEQEIIAGKDALINRLHTVSSA